MPLKESTKLAILEEFRAEAGNPNLTWEDIMTPGIDTPETVERLEDL